MLYSNGIYRKKVFSLEKSQQKIIDEAEQRIRNRQNSYGKILDLYIKGVILNQLEKIDYIKLCWSTWIVLEK